MEVSQLIELMNAVSEAGLTDFCYEENGVFRKNKKSILRRKSWLRRRSR